VIEWPCLVELVVDLPVDSIVRVLGSPLLPVEKRRLTRQLQADRFNAPLAALLGKPGRTHHSVR
jgi:hypothetical protein